MSVYIHVHEYLLYICDIYYICALVQVIAWRRKGSKPLPESVLAQFTDAYMRHLGGGGGGGGGGVNSDATTRSYMRMFRFISRVKVTSGAHFRIFVRWSRSTCPSLPCTSHFKGYKKRLRFQKPICTRVLDAKLICIEAMNTFFSLHNLVFKYRFWTGQKLHMFLLSGFPIVIYGPDMITQQASMSANVVSTEKCRQKVIETTLYRKNSEFNPHK